MSKKNNFILSYSQDKIYLSHPTYKHVHYIDLLLRVKRFTKFFVSFGFLHFKDFPQLKNFKF